MANMFSSAVSHLTPTNSSSPLSSPDDEQDKRSHILLAVVLALTMMVAFVGNTLVIFVIWNTRKLHTITCGFLLNLAISDLCAGVVLTPFAIDGALLRGWSFQQNISCQFLGFLYEVLCFVSTWTLVAISVERYIAIKNPLHYHSIVTKNRAWLSISLTWILGIAIGSIPLYQRQAYVYLENYAFCLLNFTDFRVTAILLPVLEICIPFCVMCYTYSAIGHVACTQARKKIIQCNEEHCVFVSPKKKDYRAAKILALMAGVFTFCWFPFTLLSLIQAIKPLGIYPTYVTLLSLWLTLLSSAINPWLYSILNKTFRAAMHKSAVQFLQKVTHGRFGNDNFSLEGGETTRQRNSFSHDNITDKKPEERTRAKSSASSDHKDTAESIKLETVKETRNESSKEDEQIQIPGQIKTPNHNNDQIGE